jgi:CheY-like chemotaxis protein
MDPIRILIIEDDYDIIDLLRSVLEPGYECYVAHNGLEGLQMALDGEPDLIVCDVMMPVMDGRNFMERLHALPGFEQKPIIFLTAMSSRDQIREGYEMGVSLYLTKPIDPARFKRNIDLFIKDHEISAGPKRKTIELINGPGVPGEGPVEPEPVISSPVPATPVSGRGNGPVTEKPEPVHPVKSDPGEVSPRRLTSTRKIRLEEIATQELNQDSPASGDGSAKVRSLLVDDDRDTCRMIESGLGLRHEILVSGDGISAIEQAVRYKPDIFIIDGMLPRMTGYQLTMMLKENREFFRSPIIFISGKATQRDQQYVEKIGITTFIPKPFTCKKLEEILRKLIGQPDFVVRSDRIAINQIHLEKFQRIEPTGRKPIPP